MKDIKNYVIIALFAWIVFFYTCNKPKVNTEYKTIETLRVDSIRIIDTIVEKVSNTIVKTQTDTIFSYYNDFNQLIHEFHYNPKDSSLKANIIVFAQDKPDSISFSYDFDKLTIKDSVYIKDSTHVKEFKSYLSVGAMVIGSQNSFGFAPMLQYNHKKGNSYSVGYDVINGNISIGFTKKISFK